MKRLLMGFALCWTSLTLAAPNFVGIYKCKGFDPYLNKYYSGTVTITPQNTVYHVDMDYDTGEKYDATAGLFDDNSISVVFQNRADLKQVGLERYAYASPTDTKTVQGYWVYLGKDKLGKEVCIKQ